MDSTMPHSRSRSVVRRLHMSLEKWHLGNRRFHCSFQYVVVSEIPNLMILEAPKLAGCQICRCGIKTNKIRSRVNIPFCVHK